jgi:hypothetical protein
MGRKRKWGHARGMCVLPLKADIGQRERHVRYVPPADMPTLVFIRQTQVQKSTLGPLGFLAESNIEDPAAQLGCYFAA